MKNLATISLKVEDNNLLILDQQMLPDEEIWVAVEGPKHMVSVIKDLKVRGAPLIGVSAAISLALAASKDWTLATLIDNAEMLRASRPTAVNLMNAMDRMIDVAKTTDVNVDAIHAMATEIYEEDVRLCQEMAEAGAQLVSDGDNILTHCNTGGLATVGVGTALGVIVEAHKQGKKIHVYVDETRPLLQGGRLTTWELEKAGVPYTLICDNMSGSLMAQGKVQKVFLGADRIAMNGDFANKIGTYNLAVLCDFHKVPFYTVAPQTTVDPKCESGTGIPVEMRKDSEVRGVFGTFGDIRWAPKNSSTYNPAFDVTPASLLTGAVIGAHVLSNQDLSSNRIAEILA